MTTEQDIQNPSSEEQTETLSTPKRGETSSVYHIDESPFIEVTKVNPVQVCDDLLMEAGHPNPTAWHVFLDKDAFDETKTSDVRRFLVNRALRTTLGMAPNTAPAERYALVDKGDLDIWKDLLKRYVVPVMVEFNLPN